MIFTLTYKDENGATLLEATFNAATPKEALEHLLTVPSLAPPPGTADIDVKVQS